MMATPTAELARFVAGLQYETLPERVRERVKDIVLDTLASAIAGRHGDEIEADPRARRGARSLARGDGHRRRAALDRRRNAAQRLPHHRGHGVRRAPADALPHDAAGRAARRSRSPSATARAAARSFPPSRRASRPRCASASARTTPRFAPGAGTRPGSSVHSAARPRPASSSVWTPSGSAMPSVSPAASRPAPSRTGARRPSSSTSRAARCPDSSRRCSPRPGFPSSSEVLNHKDGGLFNAYSDGGNPGSGQRRARRALGARGDRASACGPRRARSRRSSLACSI